MKKCCEDLCSETVARRYSKKTFSQNSQKKHLCKSLFFNKDSGLRPVTLLKKRLWHRSFHVIFSKLLLQVCLNVIYQYVNHTNYITGGINLHTSKWFSKKFCHFHVPTGETITSTLSNLFSIYCTLDYKTLIVKRKNTKACYWSYNF